MNEKYIKNIVIFVIGGLFYGTIEILNRGFTHITMGVLGGLAFLVIHILNEERINGKMNMMPILLVCAAFITALEFIAGEYLNGILGLNIWSYADVPMNIDGQICLPFAILWGLLALFGVKCDDFVREKIFYERIKEPIRKIELINV